jgi:ADP-ribose pyrophosphatase
LNTQGELLAQQEYSYPTGEILWQLPGGSIMAGESVEEAANRELSEESGYKAGTTRIIGYYYTSNRRSDQKQYVVVCSDLEPRQLDADPEEFIQNSWMSEDHLQSLIRQGEIHNINLLAALRLWSACGEDL